MTEAWMWPASGFVIWLIAVIASKDKNFGSDPYVGQALIILCVLGPMSVILIVAGWWDSREFRKHQEEQEAKLEQYKKDNPW